MNTRVAMRLVVAVLLLAACRPPGYGKPETPDAAASADAAMSMVDAAVDASSLACPQDFRLDGQATASSVWLTGSFVSWAGNPQAGAVEFTQGTDGAWTGAYTFQPGSHQYKYIVNGSDWILDPTNPNTVDDGMGHTNSVYTCVP